ncbi:hypothetical protein [Blastochloris tepida]|uniref:Oligosaccharide repeat unit polymerase n=1 Tax=Blastochloris tepida TaxID=2233851 RepID=A0A348G2U2_9HYPH|nr:hypothetical protein [Blastochloris tepida]BBF93875.1 hypothetical protein BLTE_25600 [Blastochloris tepida]
MTEVLFWANCLLAGVMLADGLQRREGYMEVPFLSAAMYVVWFLPQAAALLDDSTLPEWGLARVLAMSLLCLGAIWLGWRKGIIGAPKRVQLLEVPVAGLVWPTLVLTLFAAVLHILIGSQPDEVRVGRVWTGPITIMAFFSSVGSISLVLSLAMVLRRATIATVAIFAINLMIYAPEVLIYFRRASTFQLVFGCLIALYFVRGWTISRRGLVVAACLGFFFINGVGHLRALGGGYALNASGKLETRIPTLQEIMDIDWLSVADGFEKSRSISETRNAVVFMDVIAEAGSFTLGGEFFNSILRNYIPGQIVGFDVKSNMKVGADLEEISLAYAGYEKQIGSTTTGFTHPYRDWWYLGGAAFWIQAYFMGKFWKFARSGNIKYYAAYAATLGMSIHSLTHFGYYWFVKNIFIISVLWGVFRLATEMNSIRRSARPLSRRELKGVA